ncbi:hypothetical protein PF010_g32864 [Phytophthora fragariae]|uniref:Uncharacterized protein n=2 Tax=Phytophthora TaxID=4783 RepID=A0A6G0JDY3_9STRA|nr:hypothetical protein PF010_g32864 [Phytophthora fragariae]
MLVLLQRRAVVPNAGAHGWHHHLSYSRQLASNAHVNEAAGFIGIYVMVELAAIRDTNGAASDATLCGVTISCSGAKSPSIVKTPSVAMSRSLMPSMMLAWLSSSVRVASSLLSTTSKSPALASKHDGYTIVSRA